MILYFAPLLGFVGKTAKVVCKNARQMCCRGMYIDSCVFTFTEAYIIICKSRASLIVEVLPHYVLILWEFALKVTSAPIPSPVQEQEHSSLSRYNLLTHYNNNIRWCFEERRRYIFHTCT